MNRICIFAAAIVLIAAVVTGCGGTAGTEETTDTAAQTATNSPPAADGAATITIEAMAFGDPLTVAPGARITVANMDTVEHSVTSRTEGAFDVHLDGKQKGTLIAPTQPGDYEFYCVYHPSMTGTLTVE